MTVATAVEMECARNGTATLPRRMSADLEAGRIDVEIDRSMIAADRLFGFAERRNPKRAFLFVSRVLGRHIPVAPSAMRFAAEQLAFQVPPDLPGPVLVIGLAETAVGLGASVRRALSSLRPDNDTVYLASTRHASDAPLLAAFEEEHSHATRHFLYQPVDERAARLVREARSLVLVDDEMSTGRTFVNLVRALAGAGIDGFQRIVLAVLTDWSDGAAVTALGARASSASLLAGRYRWTPRALASAPHPIPLANPAQPSPLEPSRDWSRLGQGRTQPGFATRARPGERILVLGTGEYVWEPFLLAEAIEAQGAAVLFSSTTRSPIAIGHAIGSAVTFRDNYHQGIANFLYNVEPAAFDRILLCTETPATMVDPALVAALGRPEILSAADEP